MVIGQQTIAHCWMALVVMMIMIKDAVIFKHCPAILLGDASEKTAGFNYRQVIWTFDKFQ